MPSKNSKRSLKKPSPIAESFRFTERELPQVAARIAGDLRLGDWLLLEGEMGAGKTTLARAILRAAQVSDLPEGSPTFPIAHEYVDAKRGLRWVHLDLYRIRNEAELDEAGIPEYFWARDTIVMVEWLSLWEGLRAAVITRAGKHRVIQVSLNVVDENTRSLALRVR